MAAPSDSSPCWGECECTTSPMGPTFPGGGVSTTDLPTSPVSITVVLFEPLEDSLVTFSFQLTRRRRVVASGRHPLGHTLRSPAWQGWALPVSVSPEPTDAEGGGGG